MTEMALHLSQDTFEKTYQIMELNESEIALIVGSGDAGAVVAGGSAITTAGGAAVAGAETAGEVLGVSAALIGWTGVGLAVVGLGVVGLGVYEALK